MRLTRLSYESAELDLWRGQRACCCRASSAQEFELVSKEERARLQGVTGIRFRG